LKQRTVIDKKLTEVKEFRVKLYPKDFEKMRKFYEKDLQFAVISEWNNGVHDKGVMFDVGGTILELLSPKDGYKPIMGCSFSLEVHDVHALWESMKNGNNIVFPIRDNSWRDTSFCISDPEGFQITFFTRHT